MQSKQLQKKIFHITLLSASVCNLKWSQFYLKIVNPGLTYALNNKHFKPYYHMKQDNLWIFLTLLSVAIVKSTEAHEERPLNKHKNVFFTGLRIFPQSSY